MFLGVQLTIFQQVQLIAWYLPDDKLLSEPMMLDSWHIYASLGLNDLDGSLLGMSDTVKMINFI